MAILGAAQRGDFDERGYLIARGLVPRAMCDALVDGMHAFVGGAGRERWYAAPYTGWGGMEMYHHPAMWAIRQYPPVHQVFSELHGTARLWVSMDRVSYKLPHHPDHPDYQNEGFMHWDVDIREVVRGEGGPAGVQGVLALTDTGLDQGTFQCIPGIHRRLEAFIKTQGADFDGRAADFGGETFERIALEAGDLLIWTTHLAHGNSANTSDAARLAMYLSMNRVPEDSAERRGGRIECFETRRPPNSRAFGGDERGWEAKQNLPVELTELGKRLLGMDDWPAE
ncbi:MAG: hypothetical protein CMJ49_14615 [Planctomycetaceae bacterium]|nr:hypothetical protein [Planctomycetaceae bacterium]